MTDNPEQLWLTVELLDGQVWRCPFSPRLLESGTANEGVLRVLTAATDLLNPRDSGANGVYINTVHVTGVTDVKSLSDKLTKHAKRNTP